MPVQKQTPSIEYECNGITKVFPINFDCHDSDHLIVKLDDIDTPIGMWALSNGSVNFYAAPQIGSKLSIQRNTPLERLTEYNSYDNSMRPEVLNKDLDRTWYAIQEINAEVGEKVDKKLRINTTGNVIGGGELYNDLTITLKDQAVTPNKVFGSSTNIPSITLNQDGTVKEVGEQPATTGSASITIQNNSFQRAALVGDVTAALDSNTTTISNGAVSNTKLSPMSINTLKGSISLDVVQDLSVAQVQKLLNVQDGATKNQTDSYLISRTNHTGTQPIDTVKELPEVLDSKQDNLIAGDHITIKENVITALVDVNKDYVDQELAVKLGKTENAVSASKLETARRINGVLFDGTKDITLSGGEGSGGVSKDYVDQELAVKLGKTENAVSATKLQTARTISFSGAATGSFNYDGSSNSSAILTLANSGVAANTYGGNLKIPVVTVNAKGLITGVSEQNIQIVDNLTTDDATKPVSAKQAKNLQDNKLGKTENAASATNLITGSTAFTDDIKFIKSFAGSKSTSWFDNGQGKFFAAYSTGLSASFYDGGTFAIGTEVVTGKAKIMSGVVRPSGVVDFLHSHEIAYVENVLAKSGGTLTGELTAPSIRNKDFYSAGAYSFYGPDDRTSQRIKCNSILASNTWDDEVNVPELGIFARGNIVTAGTITSNGFYQYGHPAFGARATVNFNGANGAIRNGQNIASVTRTAGGTYQIKFINQMPTDNYAIVSSLSARGDAASLNIISQNSWNCTVRANYGGDNTAGSFDPAICCISIFC